jgi:HSP20 family protein
LKKPLIISQIYKLIYIKGGIEMTNEEEKKDIESKKEKKSEKLAPRETSSWWPWDYMRSIEKEFDNLRENMHRSLFMSHSRLGTVSQPLPDYYWPKSEWENTKLALLDIKDNGDELLIEAEMPGIPKENIDIQLTENSIEICGEVKSDVVTEDEGYIKKERNYQTCVRHVPLPEEIIPEKADATLEDGILFVKLPKKRPNPKEKTHKLKVK